MGVENNQDEKQFAQIQDIRLIEKAVRRIVRAHDLQSRALAKQSSLTAAQRVIMKGIVELGEVTSAVLSNYADISPATVVIILDNLEERGLIQRYRSANDRRIVHTRLTESGLNLLTRSPEPMGKAFIEGFSHLSHDERGQLSGAVMQLAELMSAGYPAASSKKRETT